MGSLQWAGRPEFATVKLSGDPSDGYSGTRSLLSHAEQQIRPAFVRVNAIALVITMDFSLRFHDLVN